MTKRNKYVVWTPEEEDIIMNAVLQQKSSGKRVKWQICADLVGKKPRQCFDLYRNRSRLQPQVFDYSCYALSEVGG